MEGTAVVLARIFLIVMMLPGWAWYIIIGIAVLCISIPIWVPLIDHLFFGSSQSGGGGCGDYSSYSGGGGSTTESKGESGKWPFNERVVIEGGKITDRGAFGSGMLPRELGRAEKRGGPFEYEHIKIMEGHFGNQKVAEIRGDNVYDSHGNKVGEVKSGFFGKTIVDKNGKEIGEIKD